VASAKEPPQGHRAALAVEQGAGVVPPQPYWAVTQGQADLLLDLLLSHAFTNAEQSIAARQKPRS
jgi:hypothetical protein